MAEPLLPISIFIITKNEAGRLGDTIRAVQGLSDDLVVVDSGSTDGTQALAESLGARVISQPWTGYGPQKRFAEDQCRYEWVLNIDADEIVSPELLREIRVIFAESHARADAYTVRIAEVFPGEKMPHRLAYKLVPVRLYRRSCGRYSASPVHDRVEMIPGAVVLPLKGIIRHHSVLSLGAQIDKLNSYSDAQAADLIARGVKLSRLRLFLEFPAAFTKAYIGRRHFLRGAYGFLTAVNYGIARHLRVAKYYERNYVLTAQDKGR